jgi:long-chain acyl-CoA synthetase
VPIENKILEDEVFEQAVVIGQDKHYLSALVVLNKEIIAAYMKAKNDTAQIDLNSIAELKQLVINHIEQRVNARFGFKKYEQIVKVCILNTSFEVGRELSAKQELKRFMIEKLYQKEINGLYA